MSMKNIGILDSDIGSQTCKMQERTSCGCKLRRQGDRAALSVDPGNLIELKTTIFCYQVECKPSKVEEVSP
jgi:hypothetical protein